MMLPVHDEPIGLQPADDEPWWIAGYAAWCRDFWRRSVPVPYKRNKRRYGR